MSGEVIPAFGFFLPPCSSQDLAVAMAMRDRIEQIEEESPCDFPTRDLLHAGCYVRTCICPAGSILASAVIKVPTVVIVHGVCDATAGDKVIHVDGFAVIKAAAGRATVWRAHTETTITMVYASQAASCSAAEQEFTDEYEKLMTRRK